MKMSVAPATTGSSHDNLSILIRQEMERNELASLQKMEQQLMDEL